MSKVFWVYALLLYFWKENKMKLEDIDKLFEEDKTTECDNIWFLAIILLVLFNDNKKTETIVNIYINGDKVGEWYVQSVYE